MDTDSWNARRAAGGGIQTSSSAGSAYVEAPNTGSLQRPLATITETKATAQIPAPNGVRELAKDPMDQLFPVTAEELAAAEAIEVARVEFRRVHGECVNELYLEQTSKQQPGYATFNGSLYALEAVAIHAGSPQARKLERAEESFTEAVLVLERLESARKKAIAEYKDEHRYDAEPESFQKAWREFRKAVAYTQSRGHDENSRYALAEAKDKLDKARVEANQEIDRQRLNAAKARARELQARLEGAATVPAKKAR